MPPTFVAIDFETADYGADSACSIGMVRVEEWQVTARISRLIRPPRQWIQFAWLHGITWERVCNEPAFGAIWPELLHMLEGAEYLVAHNAGFDRNVLRACCAAANLPMPLQAFVCSMIEARRRWGIRPTKLPNVCQRLGIELKHHDALSDAEAAARIIIASRSATPNEPEASQKRPSQRSPFVPVPPPPSIQ
jgi:DNA polymerase III subunit epsilon